MIPIAVPPPTRVPTIATTPNAKPPNISIPPFFNFLILGSFLVFRYCFVPVTYLYETRNKDGSGF